MCPLDLPPERVGRPAPEDLVARRSAMAELDPGPAAAGVTVTEETVGGVACLVCSSAPVRLDVVYLHGGGFRLGQPSTWRGFGSRLAARLEARVVVVGYRLAPEAPFPAALQDVSAVLDAVGGAARPLVLAGDSAGGGLAAAAVLAGGRPDAVVLISPWVDLRIAAASYASRADVDRLFSRASAEEGAEQYLQGHDPADPLVSPLVGPLRGFPPTFVCCGGDEVLLDDAVGLAAGLATAGGRVVLHVEPGQPHVFPTLDPDGPAGRRVLDAAVAFLHGVLSGGGRAAP